MYCIEKIIFLIATTVLIFGWSEKQQTVNKSQQIDGFGTSLAFWGLKPDSKAIGEAQKLNLKYLRVQGEVTRKGIQDQNKQILLEFQKQNSNYEIVLTFWQPRSSDHLNEEFWMDLKHDKYSL